MADTNKSCYSHQCTRKTNKSKASKDGKFHLTDKLHVDEATYLSKEMQPGPGASFIDMDLIIIRAESKH